eukprot:gnl/MRDRNA2_/MRDRNA2_103259_c0_seq1.p1 gnl/MRDRNA2_/MRDRNA2_103259_c0~~gnl/MRDRNA2_/MRDRNA2_103259_c0_seq1.p1  ORF type:complete len:170 (+),score=38.31 gnl/MRDRNA2_/MRDRNA2_103259_c0_seq1:88-597(+)
MNKSASDTQLQSGGRRRGLAPPSKHPGQLLGRLVHSNGSNAAGMLTNLRGGLRDLESEIAADENSLLEMDRHMKQMQADVDRLQYLIGEEERFLAAMADEKSLGGLMQQFDGIGDTLQKDYGELRGKHKQGIELLKSEFGYHPAYKLGKSENEFSATYYSMNPNPNKPR